MKDLKRLCLISQHEQQMPKAKEQLIYSGFIVQDVVKSAKSLNYNFSGVEAAKNDKDLYGLRYAEFVVPLVKSVQELSKMNDDKNVSLEVCLLLSITAGKNHF